jgi:hypothetical protein
MCKKCFDLVGQYFPSINEGERGEILFSATSFPFGDPDYIEKQLIELKANTDGSLMGAIHYTNSKFSEEMKEFKQSSSYREAQTK